jgi:hypothetical protein
MNNSDLANLVMVSNEAAMQWYSLVTQKAMPAQPDVIYSPLPGGGSISVGTQTGTLVLIGLGVLLLFLLMKD